METPRDRVRPTVAKLASFVTGRRSRWVVVGIWLLLFVAMLPLSARLPEVTEENYGRPDGSQSKEVGDLLAEAFPGGDTSPALLVYRRDGGLTEADRQVIEEDAQEAAEVPLAGQPIPPTEDRQTSQDGSVAFIVVPIGQGTVSETNESMEELREIAGDEADLDGHLTGTVPLLNDLTNIIKEADVSLLLATGLLVLILLLLIYRSPVLAFVPLIVVFISYTIASGVLYGGVEIGLPVSSNATSLLLVLMFGVGTDYCLLLVNRYRSALHGHENATEALADSLPRVAPAIVASGLTVIAALLALLASSLELNQAFAPANAVGVAIVMVASLTLLPAVLSLLGRKAFWPVSKRVAYTGRDLGDEEGGVWLRIGRRVLERPWVALGASVAVLCVFSLGLLVYETEADVLDQFRADTDGTRGSDALRAGFPPGTLGPVTLLLERRDGLIATRDVQAVREAAESVEGVAGVSGIEDTSDDGRMATLSLVLDGEPYDNEALAKVENVRDAVAESSPDLRVIAGGGPADRLDFREAAEEDFKVVAPIALIVIFLTLVLLLRAIVAPLYLLATVLLSFAAAFGLSLLIFKYLLDKPSVDPELPLVAFIFLVALGSDYNIFLMSRVREEAHSMSTRDAALRALGATGSVITSAGIVLAGTFAVLTVVPFYFLVELGIIVALGVLIDTFLVRTIVVPALVALVGERSWWPFRPPQAEVAGASTDSSRSP